MSYDLHEFFVVRKAHVAACEDMVKPVDQLVHAVEAEDGALFQLFGHSPAFHKHSVLHGEKNLVEAFVMTSAIQWHHGRAPADPTHQVVFFSDTEDPESQVYLRVEFVSGEVEDEVVSTGAGVVANLRLGSKALAHGGADPAARLDRLFSILIETLRPDFGHVQLPGHPNCPRYEDPRGWPNTPDIGWLTYLTRPESASALQAAARSLVIPFAAGVKILASPPPAPPNYAGAADAIAALRKALVQTDESGTS